MIEALGDPLFYIAFWSTWLVVFALLLWRGQREQGMHFEAVHLNLDAIYLELRKLNLKELRKGGGS